MENEFDLDSLEQEFEAEFNETADEETQDQENEETLETEEADQSESDPDTDEADELETDDEESEEDTDESELETDEQDPKLNSNEEDSNYQRQLEALQQELEESKKASDLIEQIATQNGLSKDELIKQFEQNKLEEDAKKQNVPVEFLAKQREMEQELNALKDNAVKERFNMQVANVRDKYNLSEDDIRSTIEYSVQNGLDPLAGNVNFEAMYKAANFDKLLAQQVKETRQKELAAKQERMKKSAVSHGGSSAPSAPSVEDEVQSFLREQGIL